jgi:hypothetical protein
MARHCIHVSDFIAQVAECNAVGKHHVISEVAKCLFIHLIILKELKNTFLRGKVSTITLLKNYGGEENIKNRVSRVYLVPTEMINPTRITINKAVYLFKVMLSKSGFTRLVC